MSKKIMGLIGSPRPDGLTNRLVASALRGAEEAGATTELVQMSECVVEACRDCLPWVCADNLKCTYEDPNLEIVSEKLLNCDGVVWGTPVYWGDTTAMVRLLMLKLFRLYARAQSFKGIPAFGIAIAGGSGNGLISGLRPLYHFFRIMWMRGINPLPVTRFDMDGALKKAELSGREVAEMEKKLFESRDERDHWYDNIPYLALSNAEERKLLAAVTYEGLPEEKKKLVQGSWAKVDILASAGETLESMNEASRIYDSSFEKHMQE
ncbi:MAG: flavodoxin family protein [Dehalococcoidales bacterium]|nr:MAG: flavodoxin family protein [Dehalococcoidales bacterium]